jgi:hypothetical protein
MAQKKAQAISTRKSINACGCISLGITSFATVKEAP